ncbi:aldo/keto reductase [Bdellovibrio bacteriovorus]|uniref:Aldo/keto reductase n=1 Tax=Bdellovibrio bacteriovorus TaxID=959 RepID=A0A150WBU8_BDEBC|nr:aldo/keto reductase [Bdellovibrio bacteriovorus]KYG60352.1 aldo/keto reductase [Bdellovibrio bacteriovorus]
MEYRKLLGSGLDVPVMSFGTATFGGGSEFFKAWGSTDLKEAQRLISVCLDNGLNLFDTANVYSQGMSEEILGAAIEGKRDQILLSTKSTFRMGDGPNKSGSTRWNIIKECEASLRRLKTDYVDLYTMHGFDANTPVEETLRALDDLITAGKIRYIGASNFSGWHLMKSLSVSERYGWSKYVAHQAYYSLAGREFEWELMPLALDQKISTFVWSPLAGGALSGKFRRNQAPPAGSRSSQIDFVVSAKSEALHNIVDTLDEISKETGKTIPQVALNWVMHRPSVTSIVIGARNEEQLKQNFGALGWKLSAEHVAKLDKVSAVKPIYPYWHQHGDRELIPSPI